MSLYHLRKRGAGISSIHCDDLISGKLVRFENEKIEFFYEH